MGTLKRTGNNVLTRVLVIAFVVSFLIFFFDNVQTTYNSYKDLEKAIENSKLEKQVIENQIEEWKKSHGLNHDMYLENSDDSPIMPQAVVQHVLSLIHI